MLSNGAIMIGQPNMATSGFPIVYIRNPATAGLTSGFDVASSALQAYTILPQNSAHYQLHPQVLTSHLQSAVQVLPGGAAFHQLHAPTLQTATGAGGTTLAYLPPHPHQAPVKRRASENSSPSTSSYRVVESKKPKMESGSHSWKNLHVKGLPGDVTKSEVAKLSSIFGGVSRVLLRGNEAIVEMSDATAAQSVVSYYGQKSLSLRNHTIKFQLTDADRTDFSSSTSSSSSSSHQEGLEAEVNCGQEGDTSSSVLMVSVESVIYPVTVDAVKKIFSSFGQIVATATFTTNDSSHLLVEFSDKPSAESAKATLNGQCMYPGGNRLKVEYSTLTSLEPQQTSTPIGCYSTSAAAYEHPQLIQPFVFESPLQHPQSLTIINPANLIAKGKDLISLGSASIIDGKYVAQYNAPIMAGSLTGNQVILPQSPLLSMGNVLLVSNLDESKVSPDALFTLFGVYGDVVRVKVMFNKKDTALIQFNDAVQAQTALLNLDKLKLWGKVIKVAPSKHTSVQMPKEGQPGANLTKDYKSSSLHRFKKPNSKNYSNIFPPSSTLHLSNIPSTSKEKLVELFSEYGTVVGFKFFSNVVSANRDCKMALMQMSTVEEAAHALIGLHNHQLAETTHLRVSFSKSNVVPHGEVQEAKEQNETESATENSESSPADNDD